MKKNQRHIIVFTAIMLIMLMVACQQTPEQSVVVNKINSPLDELVLETANPNEAWAKPEEIIWNETKTVDSGNEFIGEYTVAVSMDVKTPDYPGKVPVVIVEPERFDIELLTNAAKFLLKGEIYGGVPSKQDVMAEIIDFKKEISSHTIIDGYQNQVDEHLDFLNEEYEMAADGNSEAEFEFEVLDGVRVFLLKSYPDDGSIMRFNGLGSRFHLYDRELNKFYTNLYDARDKNIQANGIKTTYEQAQTIANEAMKKIFNDPFTMVHSNILDKLINYEYLWNDDENTSLGQAYQFCYSRVYDGYASLFIEPAPIFETDEDDLMYTKTYPREYVTIVVDDSGIVQMMYQSFSNTIEVLNENVRLMPFADVLERFKDQVFNHNIWGTSETDIKITRIDFGMVREPIEDNPDQYMMVPAWNFIGDISSWADEQGVSIIALNAINGSVITDYPTVF